MITVCLNSITNAKIKKVLSTTRNLPDTVVFRHALCTVAQAMSGVLKPASHRQALCRKIENVVQ